MITRPTLWLVVLTSGCVVDPYEDYWTEDDPAPVIDSLSIRTSPDLAGGQEVVISGADLGTAQTVVFGSRNADILETSPTTVAVVVPRGIAGGGPVDVGVVTLSGAAWLEDAFTYRVPAADWWREEVSSFALSRQQCPIEATGYVTTVIDPQAGSQPVYAAIGWCGFEMGYADAVGFAGTGWQRGFAGDLAEIAPLSSLPAVNQTAVFGPGDRRPPALPALFSGHAPAEFVSIGAARDLDRDVAYQDDLRDQIEATYGWVDIISDWGTPWVEFYGGKGCELGRYPIDIVDQDELVVSEVPDKSRAGVIGFTITEDYSDGPYPSDVPTGTFRVLDSGETVLTSVSGVLLSYNTFSGYFFTDHPSGFVGHSDLPSGVDYDVVTTATGEDAQQVAGPDELVLRTPTLLDGDVEIDLSSDLVVRWEPVDDPLSFLAVEIRVYDASIDDPNWMTELAVLVAQGDDVLGGLTIPATALGQLPTALNALDEEYDLTGRWAEMTVARHQLRKVQVEDGDLVMDFVHAVNSPVSLAWYEQSDGGG